MNTWTHFAYTSGANPYITITEAAKRNLIRRHRRAGHTVTRIRPGFWVIDDRRVHNV